MRLNLDAERLRGSLVGLLVVGALSLLLGGMGCGFLVSPTPVPSNTLDKTNGNATYVGSSACRACHPQVAATHDVHGHAFALNPVRGVGPIYPVQATRADVPAPPPGKAWTDVAYVISGYAQGALFVDRNGFVMTDGVAGVNTQWDLEFPPNGTLPRFAPYEPNQLTPLPYDYACFRCHTTGSRPQDPNRPEFQDNRPGLLGTWREPGVQCEACHGPGSNHVPSPETTPVYIGSKAADCGECHTVGDDADVIPADDGFIIGGSQRQELLASGGHAGFDCIFCHNPHASIVYDAANGRRNACADCHADVDMAIHEGRTFVRGDHVEALTCESCHMSYAGKSASQAAEAVVGQLARVGDVRSHLFRINTANANFTTMFSPDGSRILTDAQGRGAVTLDFVCLRCHNGVGNAFSLTLRAAARVVEGIHESDDGP